MKAPRVPGPRGRPQNISVGKLPPRSNPLGAAMAGSRLKPIGNAPPTQGGMAAGGGSLPDEGRVYAKGDSLPGVGFGDTAVTDFTGKSGG